MKEDQDFSKASGQQKLLPANKENMDHWWTFPGVASQLKWLQD